jgi:hypothetical protein
MIDEKSIDTIRDAARQLQPKLAGFYGKISLNYHNGHFMTANVEQTIKANSDKEREQT